MNVSGGPLVVQNTNVVEFYSRLTKDENQLTFYNSGIGTYATPSFRSWAYWKQAFGHKVDLAIAWYVLLAALLIFLSFKI